MYNKWFNKIIKKRQIYCMSCNQTISRYHAYRNTRIYWSN